jgi:hypothetical protein
MNDMSSVISPKSDQMNADDLIAGPVTIRVTGVDIRPGQEQPVAIRYDGDQGKPYKPCKSMCRIMVAAWGADAKRYVGRSMTLYRDPAVKWGGMEVGGIRISHMSDLDRTFVMALTATKGARKPYSVNPLDMTSAAKAPPPSQSLTPVKDRLIAKITSFDAVTELAAWWNDPKVTYAVNALSQADRSEVDAARQAKQDALLASAADDDFPGDRKGDA